MLMIPRTGSSIFHQQYAAEVNGEIAKAKETGNLETELPEGFDPEIHELSADENGTYFVPIDR